MPGRPSMPGLPSCPAPRSGRSQAVVEKCRHPHWRWCVTALRPSTANTHQQRRPCRERRPCPPDQPRRALLHRSIHIVAEPTRRSTERPMQQRRRCSRRQTLKAATHVGLRNNVHPRCSPLYATYCNTNATSCNALQQSAALCRAVQHKSTRTADRGRSPSFPLTPAGPALPSKPGLPSAPGLPAAP